jgi:hypothetical protein
MVSEKQDKERAMAGALEGTTVVSLEQAVAGGSSIRRIRQDPTDRE